MNQKNLITWDPLDIQEATYNLSKPTNYYYHNNDTALAKHHHQWLFILHNIISMRYASSSNEHPATSFLINRKTCQNYNVEGDENHSQEMQLKGDKNLVGDEESDHSHERLQLSDQGFSHKNKNQKKHPSHQECLQRFYSLIKLGAP